MQEPAEISFRNFEKSEAVEEAILERIERFDKFFDNVIGCHVTVEENSKHHQHGTLYHVVLDLRVPGKHIVVRRNPEDHADHQDVYIAIRDAFDAADRQLKSYVEQLRGR